MTATTCLPQLPSVRQWNGPRGRRFTGCLDEFKRDPLGVYTRANRQFGHYARIRAFPGINVYLLTHPDAVEHVLQKRHTNYRKPNFFNKPVGALTGNGILVSEGQFWLRQRRLMQPAFHHQHLVKLAPLMVSAAEAFISEHTSSDEPVEMLSEMMRLALRIASTTLLSADVTAEADAIGRAYRVGFEHVSRRMNSPRLLPGWVPTPANLRFRRAKRLLDRVVLDLIAERRRSCARPDDLLTLLLNAQDTVTRSSMSDEQVKDEALTLLTAGHETMGAALSWTWYLLARHPQVRRSVFDEVHGRLQGLAPTLADLPHLPLTRAVLEESLRLYPPAWGQPRQSIDVDEIDGYSIPPNAVVALSQYVTHRHPDFWDAPLEFRPERFLYEKAERKYKFAYFPFGGGPRICIGNTFAMMEGPLVLATILQRFDMEMANDQEVIPDPTFTLRPRNGVRMILRPR